MATLNKLSLGLVAAYDRTFAPNHDRTISVNPLVAEIATWYEKFRTAMDYREEEVILRVSLEGLHRLQMKAGKPHLYETHMVMQPISHILKLLIL